MSACERQRYWEIAFYEYKSTNGCITFGGSALQKKNLAAILIIGEKKSKLVS